jgi:DNA polymerase-3 subunit delta'
MWSVIGHSVALSALQRALDSERLAHAWLFTGPEGTGKAVVAREFAAALNCTSVEKPCGECRNCRDTLTGQHTDVELVAPGGMCDDPDHKEHTDSRDLRICQVRRIEHLLSLSPYTGRRRIAIVDSADTLHVEAANAFLKTLEEPPEGATIILLAERAERLPETVLSRCQRLVFPPIDRQTIVETLMAHGASADTAEGIGLAASGRLGWALQAIEDPALLDERDAMLDEAVRLAHAGLAERFTWAREAGTRGDAGVRERYLRQLNVWESWWRDVLLFVAGGHQGMTNNDRETQLLEEGKLYDAGVIVIFLRALAETREHLQLNVDPQLALENLMLDLPQAGWRTTNSGAVAGARTGR